MCFALSPPFECCVYWFSSKRLSNPSSLPRSLQRSVWSSERVLGCRLPCIEVLQGKEACRKDHCRPLPSPLPKTPLWQMVKVNHDQNLPPPEQVLPSCRGPHQPATLSTMIFSSMDYAPCTLIELHIALCTQNYTIQMLCTQRTSRYHAPALCTKHLCICPLTDPYIYISPIVHHPVNCFIYTCTTHNVVCSF